LSWPMGLTMLRLLLLPVFLWLMLAGARHEVGGHELRRYRWGALGIFAVMAITDKLDGYLARRLNQTSRIGALLDPLADKLLIACSLILLSFPWIAPQGYAIPIPVVVGVYAKDVGVAIGTIVLLYKLGRVSVTPRLLGKLSTFLQLALILATLLAPDLGRVAWPLLVTFWFAVILAAAGAALDYAYQGTSQARYAREHAVAGK